MVERSQQEDKEEKKVKRSERVSKDSKGIREKGARKDKIEGRLS
jgi:hypothetical protein